MPLSECDGCSVGSAVVTDQASGKLVLSEEGAEAPVLPRKVAVLAHSALRWRLCGDGSGDF